MLLAYVASDERALAQTRARARRRLQELPDHVLTAGLSASYACEAIRLARLFDSGDHDPALSFSKDRIPVEDESSFPGGSDLGLCGC